MKEKLALVIAALLVTSMAISISTTTVTAYTDQPTVDITETAVRDNAYVFITLTVSNPAEGENVENILIIDENLGFTSPMGLNENVAENWDNVADNLIAIGTYRTELKNYFLNAAQNIKNAGENLVAAAGYLDEAGDSLKDAENINITSAGYYLESASVCLKAAGENLKVEPENFLAVYNELSLATDSVYYYENLAAAKLGENTARTEFYRAGQDINNAANMFGIENLGDNILGTLLRNVYLNFDNLADTHEAAGENLGAYPATEPDYAQVTSAGNKLDNYMAVSLRNAAKNFRWAVDNLENAGEILDNFVVDNFLDNAVVLVARQSRTTGSEVTQTLLNALFVEGIENFGRRICSSSGYPENLREAAYGLENAAENQTVALWLGPRLASDIIGWYGEVSTTSARYYIGKAADNLKNIETIDLTTAGDMLYNALGRFVDAGNKIKETAALLSPTIGWGMETGGVAGANGVLFTAMNTDNCLTAGNDMTFKFLWKAPDISVDRVYTFTIYCYKMDNTCSTPTTVTITVSGKAPYVVSFVAQQTGVTTTNMAGRVLDNGRFTITLTSSETLSSIGSVYIENVNHHSATFLSLVGPLTLTPDNDNIIWTIADVDTATWGDNWENLRISVAAPWAIDLYGLENTDNAVIDNFTFDVIKPRLVNNGLATWNALPAGVKPGTTDNYLLETALLDNITVSAKDFYRGVENAKIVTVDVYVNGSAISLSHTPEYEYTGDVTFVEGVNTVSVRATDRAGNYVENAVNDNIYVDNTKPTITFVSIGGLDWTDNTVRINDNTPSIRLRISDSGWGIPKDNVKVWLCENTVSYDELGAIENLDNSLAWDNGAATTGYNWENTYENIVGIEIKGLATGWWYIGVEVNDNLRGGGLNEEENENAFMRFYVDVTAPTWTSGTATTLTTFYYQTTMNEIPTTTKIDNWYIEGDAREAGSTIKIYVDSTVTTATSSETVNANGRYDYTLSVQLSEGTHAVYFQEVDKSGNESDKVLYGTYTVDKTPPVVTLSAPADATATDAAQITVSGTIVDAIVSYDELTVTIDCTGAAVSKTIYLNPDGSFSTTVPLVEGANVINVVARDSAAITSLTGNQTITTRTVTRTVTPWATYAIIIVIVALILAAIAIFRKR